MKVTTLLFVLAAHTALAQDPGTIPWTPKKAADLRTVEIADPKPFKPGGFNANQHRLRLPEGWTAQVFHAGGGQNKARFMAWGPDSVLFVANMSGNSVLALPDKNRDGVADTTIVAARGFSFGHDVRFHRDTMYVCQEAGVVKLWRTNTDSYVFDQRRVVVDKSTQQNQIGGNHRTRTLVIDTLRNVLYVSVGSRGNADRESNRALIEEYAFDGTNRRQFATGVRNAVGMTLHPRTGALWANNNGSDNQGNNVPPEWVDIVRDGGFYGYPFGYHYRRYFSFTGDYQDLLPITPADSSRMLTMVPPAALVDAHCAPMALEFVNNTPVEEYRYGMFMVMRGSWNRNPPSGAKIVFFEFDDDDDTVANSVQDFCTGFITDTLNSATRWGRPVGLALKADGSMYVSVDDGIEMILKLTPPAITSIRGTAEHTSMRLQPNPTTTRFTISGIEHADRFYVYSTSGELQYQGTSTSDQFMVDTSLWPPGAYIVVRLSNQNVQTSTITVYR